MLSAAYDFDQALFYKLLETNWTEASTVQVDWLLNDCEQAINQIQEKVRNATKVQQLGHNAHETILGIRMIHQ